MLQAGLLYSYGTGFGSISLTDPASGPALTINGTNSSSTIYSGSISGTGSLLKTGRAFNPQVLAGRENTFTGRRHRSPVENSKWSTANAQACTNALPEPSN